jgi:hypothetical protein
VQDALATTRDSFGCRCEIASELRVADLREVVDARKGAHARVAARHSAGESPVSSDPHESRNDLVSVSARGSAKL